MPRVTIPGVGDVQFPDTMPRDEIMSRATAMQQQSSQPLFDPKDLSMGQIAKGGFGRGIEGLKGTALDLIPALGGALIGKNDYAKEQLKEYANRMAAEEEINPTAYKSYKEIQGPGDVLPYVAETIGELGPDIAGLFTGAGAGAVGGKYIARKGISEIGESIAKRGLTDTAAAALEKRVVDSAVKKGAQIGSQTGLIGSSMATNIPDVFQSIYETTGSLEPGIALTVGSLVGMLDTYLPGKVLGQLGPAGKARIARELLNKSEVVPVNWKRAFGAEILKTAGGESVTEGMQEALTIAAEQIAGDKKDFFSPQNIDRIINSAIKGAIGGTTYGAPGAAVEARRTKDIAAAEINRRAAAGEITPQEQQQQLLLLEYTPKPGMEQVETDQTKRPIEVSPGIIFDPKTGVYTQQTPEQALGREINPVMNMPQANPTLVGQGAPNVELNPAQAEMFGTSAFEQRQPSIDSALAGPPQAPAEFKTKLDADVLKGTGLKPQSGFYKQLVDKDVSKPKDQLAVAKVLAQVRSNPSLAESTRQAVEGVAMQAFNTLAKQREMFTPLGNVKKEADYGRVKPRPVSTASRESAQVPSEQLGTVPAGGIETLEQPGVGVPERAIEQPGVREEVQPDTLEAQQNEAPLETAPTVEATQPSVQAPVAETTAEQATPTNPENLKVLQDHITQLTEDLKQTEDAETKKAIKAEIDATQKDINEGKYQKFVGPKNSFRGDIAELAKNLRAALDKMGLGKVGLNIERALLSNDGGEVQGRYRNKLIEIALNSNDLGFTLDHEALHAMKDMGFFSPADWNLLRSKARSTWINQYGTKDRYTAEAFPYMSKEDLNALIEEEAIADAFADFQRQEPRVQSIMEKALNTLRRIGNFIKGYGYQTAQEIFGKAASGQLAKDRAEVIARFDTYLDTQINAEPKYQVAAARKIMDGVDSVIRSSSIGTDAQKAAISNGIERSGGTVKSAILAMLPMHALGEIANSVFPGLGSRFNGLINERSGYQNKLNNGIDPAMKELKDAIRVKPEQRKAFNKVVNQSTLDEVDPTKPRSEYVGKTDKDGNSKEAAWDKLNAEYSKLSPVWKQAYKTMRDAYKQMYNETIDAIKARIDETDLSDETKKSVKADIMQRLAERGMIEPYFALGREGDKWLSYDYKDANGQPQRAHEAFKSNYERDARKAELVKAGATNAQAYSKLSEVNYRNAPPGSFVNSVLQIMDVNKVPNDAIEETMRLFLSTLPETAFAKSFQKRKGTEGYMEDTIGVFERKMRNMAHQVANMRFNPQLSSVVNKMSDQAKLAGMSGDNSTQVAYADEFKKHLSYVLNPTKNDVGSILTSAAFTYTLGFNVSSALVNMANIPMIVAPYLKGKYSDAAVTRALGEAARLFTGSGTKANMGILGGEGRTTEMNVMPSITNYAPDSEMGKRYATAIELWNKNGQLNRSQLYEIINGDTRTGAMAKFNAMSGWMFHHGERMNREVTLLAAYNLELDRLKKQGITGVEAETKAATEAMYVNELTNGGISAAAAPRFAQNPLGKIVFMYKRYGVSMYYMMFKTFQQARHGETPEERKAAWKQLGGIVGMSALMAGAQGIPMYGALSLLYAMFCDDDDEDFDTVTRKYLGEFLYKGPVEYATNLSIAGRITLNDLIVRDTKAGSDAGTFSQQLLQALGGPVIGVADRINRGYSKINEGHFMRGIEDLLPSAISNGFKGVRYATEGTTTLRGDPITGDVSIYNAAAQALGFAPADYTRQLEINSAEKGIDKNLSEKSSKLKQKYYTAKRNGDSDGMADIKEKMLEIGAKHPELGINGITINDILKRSMTAQERATKEMIHGVRYNKKRLAEVKASLAEYED